MRTLPATALLGLLLPAVAAIGEERGAPLAESKKELQELKAQAGTVATPGVKDGLKSTAVPTFQSPAQSAPFLRELTPEQRQRESKQRSDAQKNWLLQGMNQLERESNDNADPDEETETDLTDQVDTSDPAYLLKLYEKQKKTSDAKSAETARVQRTPSADPFAPFLQGWLAGSPVKDQILSERARTHVAGVPGSISVAPAAMPGVRDSSPAALPDFGREAGAQAKPNPYLSDLASPGMAELGQSALLNPSAGSPASIPMPVATPPAAPLSLPMAAPATPDRMTPPPPLADDQKYFPQLKKF